MECRRKQNACEVKEGAETVKDLEEELLNESMDCQRPLLYRMQISFTFLSCLGRLPWLRHENTGLG